MNASTLFWICNKSNGTLAFCVESAQGLKTGGVRKALAALGHDMTKLSVRTALGPVNNAEVRL